MTHRELPPPKCISAPWNSKKCASKVTELVENTRSLKLATSALISFLEQFRPQFHLVFFAGGWRGGRVLQAGSLWIDWLGRLSKRRAKTSIVDNWRLGMAQICCWVGDVIVIPILFKRIQKEPLLFLFLFCFLLFRRVKRGLCPHCHSLIDNT